MTAIELVVALGQAVNAIADFLHYAAIALVAWALPITVVGMCLNTGGRRMGDGLRWIGFGGLIKAPGKPHSYRIVRDMPKEFPLKDVAKLCKGNYAVDLIRGGTNKKTWLGIRVDHTVLDYERYCVYVGGENAAIYGLLIDITRNEHAPYLLAWLDEKVGETPHRRIIRLPRSASDRLFSLYGDATVETDPPLPNIFAYRLDDLPHLGKVVQRMKAEFARRMENRHPDFIAERGYSMTKKVYLDGAPWMLYLDEALDLIRAAIEEEGAEQAEEEKEMAAERPKSTDKVSGQQGGEDAHGGDANSGEVEHAAEVSILSSLRQQF
jgi:hypothetical protein